MNRRLVSGLMLLWALPVVAQSGGVFELTSSSIDGGGGVATGGGFTLVASVAQTDATPASPLIGGSFRLQPGFLVGGDNEAVADAIFFNGFD